MDKANQDIRKCIKEAGVMYWQVAYALGMNDGNFSRKLRRELNQEEKRKIFEAIDKLSVRGR